MDIVIPFANCQMYCSFHFRTIPAGECAWIGASTWGTRQYRWIELPPNYGESNANGELLSNTYTNFAGIGRSMDIFLILYILDYALTGKENANMNESEKLLNVLEYSR